MRQVTLLIALTIATIIYAGSEKIEPALFLPKAISGMVSGLLRVDEQILAVGERGHILSTNLKLEKIEQENSPVNQFMTGITANKQGTLFVLGHDGLLLKGTKNHWSVQKLDQDINNPLFDLVFNQYNIGLAVGAYGTLLLSQDGGETWEESVIDEEEPHLYSVAIDERNNFYVSGEFGTLVKFSPDGTLLWKLDTEIESTFFGLELLSENNFYVYGLRGTVFYTKNGKDFEKIDLHTQASIFCSTKRNDEVIFCGSDGVIIGYDGKNIRNYSLSERVHVTSVLNDENRLIIGTSKGLKEVKL
ncbi:MAG: hypothetical protein CMO81_10560 [Waddliaceae bacterium]|nr:hypothetical protein [Waddliaceae bacterium]